MGQASLASNVSLYWEAPSADTEGNYLDPSILIYRLYVNTPMSSGFEMWREFTETSAEYSYTGSDFCATVYVTAVRTDTDAYLESDPSNEVYFCTDPEEDGDDQKVEIQLAPLPPSNFDIQVTP